MSSEALISTPVIPILKKNFAELSKCTDVNIGLLNLLYQEDVITGTVRSEIEAEVAQEKRASKLYTHLINNVNEDQITIFLIGLDDNSCAKPFQRIAELVRISQSLVHSNVPVKQESVQPTTSCNLNTVHIPKVSSVSGTKRLEFKEILMELSELIFDHISEAHVRPIVRRLNKKGILTNAQKRTCKDQDKLKEYITAKPSEEVEYFLRYLSSKRSMAVIRYAIRAAINKRVLAHKQLKLLQSIVPSCNINNPFAAGGVQINTIHPSSSNPNEIIISERATSVPKVKPDSVSVRELVRFLSSNPEMCERWQEILPEIFNVEPDLRVRTLRAFENCTTDVNGTVRQLLEIWVDWTTYMFWSKPRVITVIGYLAAKLRYNQLKELAEILESEFSVETEVIRK